MSLGERLRRIGESLHARLVDPEHATRNVVLAIAAYAVIWAVYATISNGLQNLATDMTEQAVLGRHFDFGYSKHPPMSVWIPGLWFAIFPETDWAYYLLSFTVVGVGLAAAWRIARRYLPADEAALAVALLTFIPFYNFHAIRFNANSLQIALWPLATLFFLRSLDAQRWSDAVVAGVFAALAVLTKYWAVFLLAGFLAAACIHLNRTRYFRSAAPWISIAVGAVLLAPHVVWLVQHDYVTLQYAAARSVAARNRFEIAGFYLASAAAYVMIAVALAIWALGIDRRLLRDLFPETRQAQALLALLAIPVLMPALLAVMFGANMDGLWTMPAFSVLPIVLLAARPVLRHGPMLVIFGIAALMPFLAVLLSPIAAIAQARERAPQVDFRDAAAALAAAWAPEGVPLRIVAGTEDLAFGAAFYLRDRPTAFPNFLRQLAPHVTEERIRREGMAIICPVPHDYCQTVTRERAAASAQTRTLQITLPATNLIRSVPPSAFSITIIPPESAKRPDADMRFPRIRQS